MSYHTVFCIIQFPTHSFQTKLGFHCVSASFFFDWTSQNCWLARYTRLSRPDLYAAERKELVDYMEMPPCFQMPGKIVKNAQQF